MSFSSRLRAVVAALEGATQRALAGGEKLTKKQKQERRRQNAIAELKALGKETTEKPQRAADLAKQQRKENSEWAKSQANTAAKDENLKELAEADAIAPTLLKPTFDNDADNDALYGLLRLRFNPGPRNVANKTFPELTGCALIRELHVYGSVVPARKDFMRDNNIVANNGGAPPAGSAEASSPSKNKKDMRNANGDVLLDPEEVGISKNEKKRRLKDQRKAELERNPDDNAAEAQSVEDHAFNSLSKQQQQSIFQKMLALAIHDGESDERPQHGGIGQMLLDVAELVAFTAGYEQIAVISGVGVRNYYRRCGYQTVPGRGQFLVKQVSDCKRLRAAVAAHSKKNLQATADPTRATGPAPNLECLGAVPMTVGSLLCDRALTSATVAAVAALINTRGETKHKQNHTRPVPIKALAISATALALRPVFLERADLQG